MPDDHTLVSESASKSQRTISSAKVRPFFFCRDQLLRHMGCHGASRWNAGTVFLTMSRHSAAAKRPHLISIGHVVPKLTLQDGAAQSPQHDPHQSNHPPSKKNLLGCVAQCRGETLIHDRTSVWQSPRQHCGHRAPYHSGGLFRTRITVAKSCF